MRISDWSSDVCSSDLVPLPTVGSGIGPDLLTFRGLRRTRKPRKRSRARAWPRGGAAPTAGGEFRPALKTSCSGGSPEESGGRSEEHTSELQSLMRISYDVFCLKKKKPTQNQTLDHH